MGQIPIVFLGGLSGAGKSTLAQRLVERGFWLIDIDPSEPGIQDPIDANALRSEWNRFREGNGEPIATELRALVSTMSHKRAVLLSFPSTCDFSESRLAGAVAAGICIVLLWGPRALCFEAFRKRREEESRPVDSSKWESRNRFALETYDAPAFERVRLDVFRSDGFRRPLDELEADILGRLGLTNKGA